ncbi:hypothetical protein CU633_04230 [Bacillus sp. V3-13]|uniref:TetR/AcrR family transcriptional regulator n=1 Tax=Bacillus sp. V3-13 TaxID=2053728 RepID=UPI000C7745C0|nr:TetR/AcrR family transcriptional regulator [Bacillus sp. V3-13]PLR78761.1 hypothetical protein CU633_04230 [Bacillus sp. V3-13]
MSELETAITRRKGEDTREEILEISLRLFVSKGFNSTSMQDIADAAGITKGGLYYYVKSKDDILFSLHDRFINEGLCRLEIVDKQTMGTKEKLIKLLNTHLEIIYQYKDDITLFFKEFDQLSPDKFKIVQKKRDEYYDIFFRTVEKGKNEGAFNVGDSKIVVLYMLGASNFMYQWYNPYGRMTIDQLSNIYIDFVLNGLCK